MFKRKKKIKESTTPIDYFMLEMSQKIEANEWFNNYKKKYTTEEVISIMNYICYGSKLNFKVKKKDINKLDCLTNLIDDLNGEIYIDKSALKYIYKDNIDIYNLDEIIEYTNYLDILDNIITKTYNYVNRNNC